MLHDTGLLAVGSLAPGTGPAHVRDPTLAQMEDPVAVRQLRRRGTRSTRSDLWCGHFPTDTAGA